MSKSEDKFSIPNQSKSGSKWIKARFPNIRSTRVKKTLKQMMD